MDVKNTEVVELLTRSEKFLSDCDEFGNIFNTDYITISSDDLGNK